MVEIYQIPWLNRCDNLYSCYHIFIKFCSVLLRSVPLEFHVLCCRIDYVKIICIFDMHCQKNSCHLPWIFEIHVDMLCMGRSFPKQIIAETISSNEIHKIIHLKIAINEFLRKKFQLKVIKYYCGSCIGLLSTRPDTVIRNFIQINGNYRS